MKLRKVMCLLLSIFILNGCTSLPEIQNMAYATAIGVDFQDGKWIAYAQILNFSNISHNEQFNLGKAVPAWIGRGEGRTMALALTDVSRTAQMRIFWGHVKAVVMSENALKKGVTAIYRAINRYREVRYNILVFGTKRELPEILTQNSILNLSPLETILFNSNESSSTTSMIMPITGNRAIAELNEPGEPVMIPSIDIDAKDWKEDDKAKPMFYLSGGYFFKKDKMTEWMSELDLLGMRWTQEGLERMPVQISANGSPAAIVLLSFPHILIQPVLTKNDVRFTMTVETKGFVMELLQDIPVDQLKVLAKDVISNEIRNTYRKGIKVKCDPFRLRESLYRSNPSEFHRLSQSDSFFLNKESLDEIHVYINLMNTGKYKGTKQ